MPRRPLGRLVLIGLAVLALGAGLAVARVGSLREKLDREVRAVALSTTGAPGPLVTEAELASLPEPARRYLRFMGVPGRPRDASFAAHMKARFKLSLDGDWIDAEAWQFSSGADVARFYYMQLALLGVPIQGRDTYLAGRGRMLIRPLDLVTVEDAQGRELDVSELVTWLNDAVIFAPSMLLVPAVRWTAVDDHAFDLTLTDHGTSVTGRVFLDDRGAPVDFSTEDRFHGRDRLRWTTPLDGWQAVDGRMLPTTGRAVWHTARGPVPYVEFRFAPGTVRWNVPPGA